MHSALFLKEWRQLALVRWGGIALGAVLPVAFTAGAELAQRGLLPTGRVDAYAPRDLMYELLPAALALGLWPLIALMSAAQAFAADRAQGTEAFLLERPVPRQAVWRARLTASLLTLAAVIVGTGLVAMTAASLTGVPPAIGWSRWVLLACMGIGVAVLAYFGGLAAASMLAAPMGVVLLGAVLGAVPALLVAQLVTVFPFARVGYVFLGAVLPAFLLPAFVAGSWLAFCRGEPAGRGRLRRAFTVLGATLTGVLVLFVALAPVVTRANARRGQHSVFPSPNGRCAFVGSIGNMSWGGGWIVEVASGKTLSFVPPPIHDVAWHPDGSEIAVVTWSGPLGSVRSHERIDVRRIRDGSLLRSLPIGDDEGIVALSWAVDGLVAIVAQTESGKAQRVEIEILDPQTGARRRTGFRSEGWTLQLIGPRPDKRVFARAVVDEPVPGTGKTVRGYLMYPVDVAAGKVGPAVSDAAGHPLTFAGWTGGLSPSGRYARVIGTPGQGAGPRIVDLSGDPEGRASVSRPWALWAAGDRLVWKDDLDRKTRMFLAAPTEPAAPLREWNDAQVGIEPSPGGKALFISVIPAAGGPIVDSERPKPDATLFAGAAAPGSVPEELVYFVDENRFVTIGAPFSSKRSDQRYTQWASPTTLARIAPGVVIFESIDAPGQRRFVIGGPGDLE